MILNAKAMISIASVYCMRMISRTVYQCLWSMLMNGKIMTKVKATGSIMLA